ncbi:MAG: hypothetical protein COC12_02760 [Rhodobacteraceae bacterium]|nr:MAG: hypothetical protein COC12_02760 [Paracoccaceae bacterium]
MISKRAVDAAILQGGIKVADPEIEAIGALFFEPMIFLVRKDSDVPGNPALWKGLRINIGAPGSGIRAAFDDFESAVGLSVGANRKLGLKYSDAVAALVAGTLDITVFVAPIDAPYLVAAYGEDALRLLPLQHTEAISRRLEYAKTVTVPTGAISLWPVVPSEPQSLMALEARLAITPDLHPALVTRLTMAAIELHNVRGVIMDQGMFPSVEGTGLPFDNAARQLIINGPSIWHDWLPYWMASQAHRLVLLMLPILIIMLSALRAVPMVYAYFMRWRVWQHYPEIKTVEDQLAGGMDDDGLRQADAMLADLDDRLSQLRLPAAYRQPAYDARIHVELIRSRIAKRRAELQTG